MASMQDAWGGMPSGATPCGPDCSRIHLIPRRPAGKAATAFPASL